MDNENLRDYIQKKKIKKNSRKMIFFSGAYSLEILFMFGNTEESQAQAILDLRGIKFLCCGIYFSSPSC